ncbi:unnamed protein product [Ceratitis capitata]|uniref:(Mediterranean fruit fly) hypothetical protein n=1 Tax=Ceratitis capitata TaxID=7213 RepID=A0A811USH7_CERCA|nr:unnamed protein product [Ceratitis capitata]
MLPSAFSTRKGFYKEKSSNLDNQLMKGFNLLNKGEKSLSERSELFDCTGFDIEIKSENEVIAREIPAILGTIDVKEMLMNIVDRLTEIEDTLPIEDKVNKILATIACYGSIRAVSHIIMNEVMLLQRIASFNIKAFDMGKNRFDSEVILKVENSKGITLKHIESLIDDIDLSKYNKVKVFYNKFYNTFTQKPTLETIKPWSKDSSLIINFLTTSMVGYGYGYEPQNTEFILQSLIRDYITAALYSALLESVVSENSARMVAMESANRNTEEMLNKLALLYNRSRQAAITTDLIEVIGGAESL